MQCTNTHGPAATAAFWSPAAEQLDRQLTAASRWLMALMVSSVVLLAASFAATGLILLAADLLPVVCAAGFLTARPRARRRASGTD